MPPTQFIVLTGGPGAGKTATVDLLRKIFFSHINVLPEAASIVYGGGFARGESPASRKAAQSAIFHVQKALEMRALGENPAPLVVCDRGSLDGLAYWPEEETSFWEAMHSTRQLEIERYRLVIHLRTPTHENGYDHSNPVRTESVEEAIELDERIRQVWQGHPRRVIVESTPDFMQKVSRVIELVREALPPVPMGDFASLAGFSGSPLA